MCTQTFISLSCKDFLLLFLGFILSGFWPFILYLLKPSLEIVSFEKEKEKDKFKLKVQNNAHSDAVNLKFEICSVDTNIENNPTKHFDLAKADFLILPKKRDKTSESFRNFELTMESELKLNEKLQKNSTVTLRVRLHACHAYSGFGKAFECFFDYNEGRFELRDKNLFKYKPTNKGNANALIK